MERLKTATGAALLSLLSLAVLTNPLVKSLQIRPQACYNSAGDLGTCMFVWDCIKTEGKHLGTCADGFLFGSCCAHSDSKNNLFPEPESTTISSLQIFSAVSSPSLVEESGDILPTIKPGISMHISTLPPITSGTLTSRTKPSSIQTSTNVPLSTAKPLITVKHPSITVITQSRPTKQPNQTKPPRETKPTKQTKPTSQTKPPSQTRPPIRTKPPNQMRPTNQADMSLSQANASSSQTNFFNITNRPIFHPTTKPFPSTTNPTPYVTNRPSLVTIENFLIRSTVNSSIRTTQKPLQFDLSVGSTGQVASHQYSTFPGGWFRPTGYTTRRPQHTTKRPQTTERTTHYPFLRPTWKPRPPSSGYTTSKPHVFTFSTYYPTKPSTSSTGQSSIVLKSTTVSVPSITVTSSPVAFSKTTTQSTPTKKPITTTYKPVSIDVSTINHFNVTMIPFFTPFRPEVQTASTLASQLWFTTSTTKLPSNDDRYNTTVVSGNVVVESTTPIADSSTVNRPTFRPTGESWTVKTSIISSINEMTTVPSKQTTSQRPCGVQIPHPKQKVVGGTNSAFGSWPWQASVRRTSFFGFSSTHRCGGALISRQWVATAGHCVDDLLLSQIKIRVGEYDFASVQEPHGYVERGAKKKVVHPRYNFFTYENDLALVQLEEAIDSIKYPHISPICLPPSEENLVGRNATVTGWGRLSEGGILPSILQEVQVPIISNEKCKNMFLAAGRHEYIPDIFMCAGFEEGGRDSCQGDSGGPLQIQADEGYWFLAGIISWGIGCAEPNMPGVCTRISKFRDWVIQHVT